MTNKTIHDLIRRVAHLEQEVCELKSRLPTREDEPWWERTAGMFSGDQVFEEIVKEMRKLRRANYAAARGS